MDDINTLSSLGGGAILGAAFFSLMILYFFLLAIIVIAAVSNWKIFKKAGLAGWEALVPFYNIWCLVKISGLEWWFSLIIAVPLFLTKFSLMGIIPIAASFFVYYNLSIKFDKEPIPFALGLTFLPFIFLPILAFGKNTYKDNKVSPYGLIEKK